MNSTLPPSLPPSLPLSIPLQLTESLKRSVDSHLKSSLSSPDGVELLLKPIITSALHLSEVMVISGLLKLTVVEGRMKMEHGGMQRQALRLGIYIPIYNVYTSLCTMYSHTLYVDILYKSFFFDF